MRHPIATQRVLCLVTLLGPAATLATETAPPALAPESASSALPASEIAECLGGQAAERKTRKTIADLRASGKACRRAWTGLMAKATQRSLAPTGQPEVGAATIEAIKAKEESVAAEVPSFQFGQSNWSLTIQAFLGLTRVTLGRRADGTVDQFAPLSGLGSGLKLRHSYVDAKDKARELLGLSAGLYYEPKVPVSGATGNNLRKPRRPDLIGRGGSQAVS